MTQEKKTRQRKLTSVKQRIARLTLTEKRALLKWIERSLQDDIEELKAAHAKALSRAKPGEIVTYWSWLGFVDRTTRTAIYVKFPEAIYYRDRELGNIKTSIPVTLIWSKIDNPDYPVQLLDRLPGFGRFELYAAKDGKEGTMLGRTPLFAHALYYAFNKASPELDILIKQGGAGGLTVTRKLRAQFHCIKRAMGSEAEFAKKVQSSIAANWTTTATDSIGAFKRFMEGNAGLIPEEFR